MKPIFDALNVRAPCPDCGGAVTTFEHSYGGTQYGSFSIGRPYTKGDTTFPRTVYQLLKCAGCGRGGLATVPCAQSPAQGVLLSFFPRAIDTAPIPGGVPQGIASEFREAELCASIEAWRASSALLRSTLEKTLKAYGYKKGSLQQKINDATKDGVITAARSKRAHDDIRVLGNDVLHEEWREVTEDEINAAHQYAQRILEDFYDDRPSVEEILVAIGRFEAQPNGDGSPD